MKIEDLLSKPLWKRRLPPKTIGKKNQGLLKSFPMQFDTGSFITLSQSDFANELHPSSHLINSTTYKSLRYKYKYNPNTKENEIVGFDDVERIAIAIQEGIARHKTTHTFGNDIWFGSEGRDKKNEKRVAVYRSHWNMTGMKDAILTWGNSLFTTGDAGLYLYRDEDVINYKVFSFNNEDVICERKDADGNDICIRMFMYGEDQAVEIYGHKEIEFWVKNSSSEKGTIKKKEVSEDGYVLFSRTPHGLPFCPVIYGRIKDVVWGPGQSIIEHIENLLSDLAENNKYYAYQILFLSGGVVNLPEVKSLGKVIASKSDKGKAEILKPADASNTFTIDLEKNFDILWETTGTVVIEPKELHAGENTGAFIKNLYFREVQWSTNMISELRPTFNKIVRLFATLVGAIENDSLGYKSIKMSYLLEPFVPKNITEEITQIVQVKNAGITSVQTASGEVYFNNPNEYERIREEAKDEEVNPASEGAKPIIDPITNKKTDNNLVNKK